MGILKVYTDSFIPVPVKSFVFSGGEVQVQVLDFPSARDWVTIESHMTSANDVMELVMLTDILRRVYGKKELRLVLPYLPYARQDRAMVDGEALGVKAFSSIINSLGYGKVYVWDVHSDVSLAVLNNSVNVPPETFLKPEIVKGKILVSPDAGSLKKVTKVAQKFGCDMVRADKTRSVKDGSITGTVVYNTITNGYNQPTQKNFLIVDDICDGGRTFLELAKELRPLTTGEIELYVTHGIFSKGLGVFEGVIDHIYCALPFPGVDLKNPILTVTR